MRVHEILAEDAVSRFSPAFWAWFRNSKVVDQNGQPLRVYHSTFAEFESFYSGSHFGDIEAANARWTNYRKDGELPRFGVSHGGAILPVYLSIQNPLRVQDDKGLTDGNDLALAARYAGVLTKAEYEQITATGSPGIAKRRLFKFLEQQGYDGLVYRNAVEGRADSWVPFWPNQIKSAIANRGTWDPGSESITESHTPTRTLYHGTSSALLDKIRSEGLLARDIRDTFEYLCWLGEQVVGSPLPRVAELAFRQHARGYHGTPAVYTTHERKIAESYARSHCREGGELGWEALGILREDLGITATEIWPDARPAILTLAIPEDWLKPEPSLRYETLVLRDVPPECITDIQVE